MKPKTMDMDIDMNNLSRPAEILLVEDNPGDVELIAEALREGGVMNHVNVACDGEQATKFLARAPGFETAPRPDLILLDLNIPKKSGFELLGEIRATPELSRIPVVILTSSEADRDILKSYELHANCFICKPVDVDEFLATVRSTGQFWLMIVRLPLADPAAQP
jgi:chemotaxis family two-component system response regulator Rcp1